MKREIRVITLAQLALRNGQDKPEVWVAYKGEVYDVSLSRLWKQGKHYEHWAGQDLTNELTHSIQKEFSVDLKSLEDWRNDNETLNW